MRRFAPIGAWMLQLTFAKAFKCMRLRGTGAAQWRLNRERTSNPNARLLGP